MTSSSHHHHHHHQQQQHYPATPPTSSSVWIHNPPPPPPHTTCETLLTQATTHEEQGNYTTSLTLLQSCLNLYNNNDTKEEEEEEGDDKLDMAFLHHKIGMIYWKLGSYQDSLKCLYRALDIYTHVLVPRLSSSHTIIVTEGGEVKMNNHDADVMTDILNSLGRVYYSRGEYEKSMNFYQESFRILKQVYGTATATATTTSVVEDKENVGQENHQEDAETHQHQEEEEVRRKGTVECCGASAAATAGAVDGTATQEQQEKVTNQQQQQQRTTSIDIPLTPNTKISTNSSNHPTPATTTTQPHNHHRHPQQQHPPIINPSLNHPIIARTIINMGKVYDALGKYKRSMRYYREGLRTQRVLYGSDHVDVAHTLNLIGMLYEKFGGSGSAAAHQSQSANYDRSLGCFMEALDIYKSNASGTATANSNSNSNNG
eukprot:11919845-Ditylum_brightwellii.AAC.1